MTFPMMHSSTLSASMPARATASRTTSAPSGGAHPNRAIDELDGRHARQRRADDQLPHKRRLPFRRGLAANDFRQKTAGKALNRDHSAGVRDSAVGVRGSEFRGLRV